jgi:hypothetical protein
LNEVVVNGGGEPFARLSLQYATAVIDGLPGLTLTLTFKGHPRENTIDSAVEFLKLGREKLVTTFEKITTSEAQDVWGRING